MDSDMNDRLDTDNAPRRKDASPQTDEAPVEPAPQLLLTTGHAPAEDATPPASKSTASEKAGTRKSKPADTGTENENKRKGKPEVAYEGKAVIDRFEGKWAVLLVGDDEKSVAVLRKSLPRRVQAGEWLNVQLGGAEGDKVVTAEVDHEETARMRKRIADKLARLRSGAYLTDEEGDR